jgi:hypothetical protein
MSFLDDSALDELNGTWRNLLGINDCSLAYENATENSVQPAEPVVADPWSELLHAQGIELIDLQQYHPQKVQVSFSEQEVEQALQFLQEQ